MRALIAVEVVVAKSSHPTQFLKCLSLFFVFVFFFVFFGSCFQILFNYKAGSMDEAAWVEAQLLSHAPLTCFRPLSSGSGAVSASPGGGARLAVTCALPGLPRVIRGRRYALSIWPSGGEAAVAAAADWRVAAALAPCSGILRALRCGEFSLASALNGDPLGGPGGDAGAGAGAGAAAARARSNALAAALGGPSFAREFARAREAGSGIEIDADVDIGSQEHEDEDVLAPSEAATALAAMLRALPAVSRSFLATAAAAYVRGAGAAPALTFSVAEWSAGTLADVLRASGEAPAMQPFTVVFPLAQQLSRALAVASDSRTAHRAVLAANVFLLPPMPAPAAASSSADAADATVQPAAPGPLVSLTSLLRGGADAGTAGTAAPVRYALGGWALAVALADEAMLLPVGGPASGSSPSVNADDATPAATAAASAGDLVIGGSLQALPPEVLAAATAAAAPGVAPSFIPYAKCDVWSLAVLLFAVASGGRHPWPGYPSSPGTSGSSGGSSNSASASSGASVATAPRGLLACPPAPMPAHLPLYFRELLAWALRPLPGQRITARAFASRCDDLATGAVPRPLPTRLFPWFVGPLTAQTIGAAASGGEATPMSATLAADASAPGWALVRVRCGDGLECAVPAFLGAAEGSSAAATAATVGGVSEATFGDVLAAALEMLPGVRLEPPPKQRWALLLSGRAVDAGVPVRRLLRLIAAGPLTLAPVAASLPPQHTVPGFGVLAAADGGQTASGSGMTAGAAASAAAPSQLPAPAGKARLVSSVAAPAAIAAAAAASVASVGGGGAPGYAAAGTGTAVAPASVAMHAREGLEPLFAFSDSARGTTITLSESGTVATTRDKWATVLLNGTPVTEATHPAGSKYEFTVHIMQMDAGAGCAVGFANVVGVGGSANSSGSHGSVGRGGVSSSGNFDAAVHNLGAHAGSWAYSKTGKISNGMAPPTPPAAADGGATPQAASVWAEYGEPFGEGDLITCEVEPQAGRIRFLRNGVLQGTAFVEQEIRSGALRPAVCMGSTGGGKLARVQLVTPQVREFDRSHSHHRVQFSEDGATVFNAGKWATSLASHAGILHGRIEWSIRLDDTKNGAGVAIGVVDVRQFDWDKQNLGASPGSWCFSKTGKIGDGSGFTDYGRPFTCGDVVTVTLDMDNCTLAFTVNGEPQGVAYNASACACGFASSIAAAAKTLLVVRILSPPYFTLILPFPSRPPPSLRHVAIGTVPLVPAVCLGSTEGGKLARVSILNPLGVQPLRRLDRINCSPKLRLSDNFSRVETSDKWGTVFLDSPVYSSGRVAVAMRVVSAGAGCGAGIGFADPRTFKPQSRNLGAAADSWCYSKTGKKSAGGAFTPYAQQFKTGDVVSAELDFEEDTMRFFVNGRDQGVAFGPGEKFAERQLVPALVLGSSDGGHFSQLQLVPPAVTRIDPRRCNKHIALRAGDRTASTDYRWSSALAEHPGTSDGPVRFAVRLEGDGGAAVGFAEASTFRAYMHVRFLLSGLPYAHVTLY